MTTDLECTQEIWMTAPVLRWTRVAKGICEPETRDKGNQLYHQPVTEILEINNPKESVQNTFPNWFHLIQINLQLWFSQH